MSLEERTLVVREVSDRVSRDLLRELFVQAGPVSNVVLRPDFAYIEFEHKISVAYALALMDGICLFGRQLFLEPKLRNNPDNYQFVSAIQQFNHVMRQNPDFFRQFLDTSGHDARRQDSRRHSGRHWRQ